MIPNPGGPLAHAQTEITSLLDERRVSPCVVESCAVNGTQPVSHLRI